MGSGHHISSYTMKTPTHLKSVVLLGCAKKCFLPFRGDIFQLRQRLAI